MFLATKRIVSKTDGESSAQRCLTQDTRQIACQPDS